MHIRTHWCLNGYFSITQPSASDFRPSEHIFSCWIELPSSAAPFAAVYLSASLPLQVFFFHHLLFVASPLSPSLLSLSPLPASLSLLSSHSLCLLVFNALLSLSFSAPLHTTFNSIWPVVSYRFTDTQLITETSDLTCGPLKENKELHILKLTWGMRCLTRR